MTGGIAVDDADAIDLRVLVNGETINTALDAILKDDFLTQRESELYVYKNMTWLIYVH